MLTPEENKAIFSKYPQEFREIASEMMALDDIYNGMITNKRMRSPESAETIADANKRLAELRERLGRAGAKLGEEEKEALLARFNVDILTYRKRNDYGAIHHSNGYGYTASEALLTDVLDILRPEYKTVKFVNPFEPHITMNDNLPEMK